MGNRAPLKTRVIMQIIIIFKYPLDRIDYMCYHVRSKYRRGRDKPPGKGESKMKTAESQADYLETEFVDKTSVAETLDVLAAICREKAEHLRANWQDCQSARVWEKAANQIDVLAAKIAV